MDMMVGLIGGLPETMADRTPKKLAAFLAVVLLVAPACSVTREPGDPQPKEVRTAAVPVARLPDMATGLAARHDGDELLVSDRSGRVWRVSAEVPDNDDLLEPSVALDLSEQVSLLGERGMFDVEFVPDRPLVAVSYTDPQGAITVDVFPYAPGEPIDRSLGRTLLSLARPYAWHNGGGMAFDRDDNLLLGIGDMEFRGLGTPGSQDPTLLLGGILRIPRAAVVGDDPAWRPSSADMVARGLRNPWRIATDPLTGDVWIGDVGLNSFEEVNRISADRVGATTNFGWPFFEGSEPGPTPSPPEADLTPPVLARSHESDGACGIVGGGVYRGAAIPSLIGWYLYSDLCGSEVRGFRFEGGRALSDRAITELAESLVSFGVGPGGEVYGLGSGGLIVRLQPSDVTESQPTPTARPTQDCEGLIAAIVPLEGFGDLEPAELERRVRQANRDIAEAMTDIRLDLAPDGRIIQAVFLELQRRLEQAGWDPTAPAVLSTRDEMLAGEGAFEGLPDALARTVDATCG